MDSIVAAGFEKYSPGQYCDSATCLHSAKQTHYHCKKCSYTVLGLSQMEAHKYRHANEDGEGGEGGADGGNSQTSEDAAMAQARELRKSVDADAAAEDAE